MYYEKLHISQIFSNLECSIFKLYDLVMCNLYTKFVNFLEICKKFSEDLVTEFGNIRRPGPVPRFSDLEVIALSMAAEAEEIDSENWLFEAKLKECRSSIPNLISRRQFNDRRKSVSGLCEQIRSRIANRIDGGEDYFCIKNWKPTFIPFAKARKRVETLFSQLTDQFLVIRNYAKETCGLFARIVGKVSAMTALQYIYYINSKPIGRIKYALI